MNTSFAYYESFLGTIKVSGNKDGIKSLDFVDKAEADIASEGCLAECISQLDEYFKGRRTRFDLKLNPEGTEFQKRVWRKLMEIQFGSVVTYGELAASLGDAKASRAVGSAVGKNPVSIIIPCHRVIGKDKSLTGFAWGLPRKEWLLSHEGFRIINSKVCQGDSSPCKK